MIRMSLRARWRALVLAPLTLATVTLATLTLAGAAQAETKTIPLGGLFPYLEGYLKLAPTERSRFTLNYRLIGDAASMASVKVGLVAKGRTAPMPLAGDGRILTLPTLSQFQDGTQVSIDAAKGSKLHLELSVEPALKPAPEMDAHEISAAIDQAQAGEQKLAGLFAFAAPKLTRAIFLGVKSGEAVGPDGKTRPLPLYKGAPAFDPSAFKGARSVRLSGTPTRVELAQDK